MAGKTAGADQNSPSVEVYENLPSMPRHSALSLSLPPTNRDPSLTGLSSQSMRTSSFAMSDMSESKLPQLESLRIRSTYTPSSQSRKSTPASIPESETTDYHDEADFQNTDRLGP